MLPSSQKETQSTCAAPDANKQLNSQEERTVECFQDKSGNQISLLIVDYFRYQIFQIIHLDQIYLVQKH